MHNFIEFLVFFLLLLVPVLSTFKLIEIDENSPKILPLITDVDMDAYNKNLRFDIRTEGLINSHHHDDRDFQLENKFPSTFLEENGSTLKEIFPIGQLINNRTDDIENVSRLDSWSIIWYIGSFGGLIAFFLLVSCSEWCCRRHGRNNCSSSGRNSVHPNANMNDDTPPPSYDQFAPPSYDSVLAVYDGEMEKREFDVYVVPVHVLERIDDQPPSYTATQQPTFYSSVRIT